MEELKENEMMFDDSEFDDFNTLEEKTIELDEEFEKQLSKKIDNLLKEHPLQYEE